MSNTTNRSGRVGMLVCAMALVSCNTSSNRQEVNAGKARAESIALREATIRAAGRYHLRAYRGEVLPTVMTYSDRKDGFLYAHRADAGVLVLDTAMGMRETVTVTSIRVGKGVGGAALAADERRAPETRSSAQFGTGASWETRWSFASTLRTAVRSSPLSEAGAFSAIRFESGTKDRERTGSRFSASTSRSVGQRSE